MSKDNYSSLKAFLESQEYEDKKARLNREINMFPLVIDRVCFQKTKQEKIAVANAKSLYKIRSKNKESIK